VRYLFHVHRAVPSWRLVIRDDTGMPAETSADQWRFTRSRSAEDTNPDVVREVDERGWSLFRLGGDFSDVAADVARRRGG
jgi:hypothetical protein